jgi:histidinol-phosphate aminotransferase
VSILQSRGNLTRRGFLQVATGASLVHLPGIGRIPAKPFAFGRDDYYGRLCYNENPLGPSPLALEAMKDAASMAHRYPDWFSSTLEAGIADYHGLQQSSICAGCGATEVIRLIADAFLGPGDEVVTATPTYSQMASEATANGATVVHVPVDENYVIDLAAISQAISPATRLVSLVNPNNPLGTIIHKADMEGFLTSLPGGIITVIDEAYHYYVQSPDYESCVRFVADDLPVVVVRTFSKVHGLAGARIGYSIAPTAYSAEIASSQPFGMVSRLGQAAAEAALGDAEHVANTVALNEEAMALLEAGFTDLGLAFIESETNYVMFDTGTSATWVAAELASRGYQVRTGWGMPQHIRVSTGTVTEMEGFLEALQDILGQTGAGGHDAPGVFGLGPVRPNPFRTDCEIRLSSFGAERVTLTIHDVVGRKVRTLLSRSIPTGLHLLRWDAADSRGRRVGPGTYVINLTQGEFAASTRVTLSR